MKQLEDRAVENFLGSLDMSMPMIDHFRNAMRDAMVYQWSSATVVAIMSGVEDKYLKKEK